MAEIKIEKKRPVWPWIVAALIIAVLVYFFVVREDQVQYEKTTEVETTTITDSIAD